MHGNLQVPVFFFKGDTLTETRQMFIDTGVELAQMWQQVVPQAIAGKDGVGVAQVFDMGKPMLGQVLENLRAGKG